MRTVSQLADLAGVTVRALHHYDEIGLLVPSARSAAGYRLYDHDDLIRLQEILTLRELGVGLADIAAALDDPSHDRVAALRSHRDALAARVDDLTAMVRGLDDVIAELSGGPAAEEATMFEGFDPSVHEEEARERWGDTDAWRQSQERTAGWSRDDVDEAVRHEREFVGRLAQAMREGAPPDSPRAMDLAEQARTDMARYYDCSHEMHVQLGEMYVADARFTAHYDREADGLAVWFRDAIVANAARHGVVHSEE